MNDEYFQTELYGAPQAKRLASVLKKAEVY